MDAADPGRPPRHADAPVDPPPARSGALLQDTLQCLPEAVLLIDRTGAVQWFNAAAGDELDGQVHLGGSLRSSFPGAAGEVLDELVQRALRGAPPAELRADAQAESLGRRWSARARAVRDDCALLTLRELPVAAGEKTAPRQPSPSFRRMADDAPVMIWVSGPEGGCEWFNAQWLTFRGRTLAEERGDGWRQGVHRDDLDMLTKTYRGAIAAQEPFRVEFRLRRHDGAWCWILGHGMPRFDAQSRFIGFAGSCIDVTERRQLEDERRHAQKLEAVGRVVSTIAHDYNNLLTVVLGQSELIRFELDELGMAAQQRLHSPVDDLVAAVDRARVLTQRLLAFGSKRQLHVERIDVEDWAQRFSRILRRLVRENVVLDVRIGEELPWIEIDRSQLEQIVLNLAVNASDAMPSGGRLRVGFTTAVGEQEQPGLRLTVADDGVGIPFELQERIFEPFFTTRRGGRGVGIGLATVREIVDAAGGEISVCSEPDRGTAFEIWFPAVEPGATATTPAAGEALRLTAAPAACRTMLVLVCEDDPAVRAVIETTLRSAGHMVRAGSRPEDLLAQMAVERPQLDAVVSDVVMPGMAGPDFAAKLQEILGPVPVVFVSGYAGELDLEQANCGISTCHLSKPFSRKELLAAVQRCGNCRIDRGGG